MAKKASDSIKERRRLLRPLHAVLALYNTPGLAGKGACWVTRARGYSLGATLCRTGDLPGWETPGGFSKALLVCLDPLFHQLTWVDTRSRLRASFLEKPPLKHKGAKLFVGKQFVSVKPGVCTSLRTRTVTDGLRDWGHLPT